METVGLNLSPPTVSTSFPHLASPSVKVRVMLNVCLMLKSVRNCFASYGILKDHSGNKINWNYNEQLHKLQQSKGLRLGNKLKSVHMMWNKQKIKVNLAAQTLSASADAIKFSRCNLKLFQFSDSEATVQFVRLIDRLTC